MSKQRNYWDPRDSALAAYIVAGKDRVKARRIDLSSGLDTKVVYYTIASLAAKAEVNQKVITYAMAKGRLVPARRQAGRAGVLFHPEEGNRWLDERAVMLSEKEMKKC